MSIYVEKAKELAQLILESDIAKNMADASAIYDADKEAVALFENYKLQFEAFQQQLQGGKLSENEYKKESERLNGTADELRKYPSIAGIISAETEFNNFVTEIMNVLRVTIMGQIGNACGSGNCSGCKEKSCTSN